MHLFEFEDQSWFPAWLRDPMTDFLGVMARLSRRGYGPFVDQLGVALDATRATRLVDLGSGNGAAAVVIAEQVNRRRATPVRLLLTDFHPNLPALARARAQAPAWVDYCATPVDAGEVPADLDGFRLMCNSFHHLPPARAARVLTDAVAARQGIAVMEMVERTPLAVLGVFAGLLILLVATPFIRPFSVRRLVFTYLVPLVPLALVWDGIVSCLRVYSPRELQQLIGSVPGSAGFDWVTGRLPVPGAPTRLTCLIGVPRPSAR